MSKPFTRTLLDGAVQLTAEHGHVVLAFPPHGAALVPRELELTPHEATLLGGALSQFAREAKRQQELAGAGKRGRP
jgi:hypothetical protein